MKQSADIEQLEVHDQPQSRRGQATECEDPVRVVVKEFRLGVPYEVPGGSSHAAVRDLKSGYAPRHFFFLPVQLVNLLNRCAHDANRQGVSSPVGPRLPSRNLVSTLGFNYE
jgi:hypothetical protein